MILGLAPMEGVVDPVIREIYSKYGAYDFCVSEFIRITHQLLPEKVFYRYLPELHTGGYTKYQTPVFAQLLGSDPQCLLDNALRLVDLGALAIDINFGCPAKTVNRHSGGAKLLESPQLIYSILSLLREKIPTSIPVSAKIRLGYEDDSLFSDIMRAVNSSQINWLTIHARTKKQGYNPPAHWHKISEAVKLCDFPVLANGDIWTVKDFKTCTSEAKTEDAVLGRGAFANLQLAQLIKQNFISKHQTAMEKVFNQFGFKTTHNQKHSWGWDEQKNILREFVFLSEIFKDEKYAVTRTKQWSKFMAREFSESQNYFDSIKRMKEKSEVLQALNQ